MNTDRLYAVGFLVLLVGALCFAGYALSQGRYDLAGTALAAAVGLVAPPPRSARSAPEALPEVSRGSGSPLNLLPVLALCLGLSACATLSGLGALAIDCSAAPIARQAGLLLSQVVQILRGGDPSWQAQLDQLAAGGREALACAVSRVASQPSPVAGTGLLPVSAADEAPELARRYLAQRGLVVR